MDVKYFAELLDLYIQLGKEKNDTDTLIQCYGINYAYFLSENKISVDVLVNESSFMDPDKAWILRNGISLSKYVKCTEDFENEIIRIRDLSRTKPTEEEKNSIIADKNGTVFYSPDFKKIITTSTYHYHSREYVVKDGTEMICDNAFAGQSSLSKITLPDTITSIGFDAFSGTHLYSLTLPPSLTYLGGNPFCSYCIGNIECQSKHFKVVGKGLYSQDMTILICCFSKEEVFTIPDSVKRIEDSAFCYNETLKSIHIPLSVTEIGKRAFSSSNLETIKIPESVKSIGDSAFSGCRNLETIKIPESVKSIGKYAFGNCKKLHSISLPNCIDSIPSSCFYDDKSLETLILPNSTQVIGDYAFSGCSSLKEITIPENVVLLYDNVFHDCKSLKSITFPASLLGISWWAFLGSGLECICFKGSETMINRDAFNNCKVKQIVVPKGSKDFYLQYLSEFKDIISESTE